MENGHAAGSNDWNWLSTGNKFIGGHTDVLGNLTQKNGRKIARPVVRNSRLTAVCMTELTMRAALPNLGKAKSLKDPDDFPRLENW